MIVNLTTRVNGQISYRAEIRTPNFSVPKLQSCLGVRVENPSSKETVRGEYLEQNVGSKLYFVENHGDFSNIALLTVLWQSPVQSMI